MSVTGVTGDRVALAYLERRRDKARERLFAAGWQPATYALPQPPEFHDLLLALNAADVAITRRRIRS